MNESDGAARAGAPDQYLVGGATSFFSISDLRVRIWPILATVGLGLVVILPSGLIYTWLTKRMAIEQTGPVLWLALLLNHGVMLIVALVLIAWLSKGRLSEFGLEWPRRKTYVWAALVWGAAFGLLMTVVDYFPQILKHIPPPENLSLTPASIGLWLFFQGFYVGPTEEIPFRGLMQTFLMQRTSGRVRLGPFEMHVAGVILALLFAIAHISSFWQMNFWFAFGQQLYALALGILYAYWREKSGSLLAPIIGHNMSDGVEYLLMFLMTWVWR